MGVLIFSRFCLNFLIKKLLAHVHALTSGLHPHHSEGACPQLHGEARVGV